jgi:two-component system, OmpR family, sensor kinase
MNSIRRKLLVVLIGAMSVVILLGAAATYSAARDEADTIFDYHLEQIALALRNQTFQGSTEALAGEKNFDFVIRVWDRSGLSIYYSRPHRVLPDIARLGYATEQTSEGAWRVYALQYLGQTIAVAQPLSVRAELAASAALRTLIPFIVLLPLLALLVWVVVSRELRPLTNLARLVGARTADTLDPIGESGVPEEARPLVQSLNDLLDRLQSALRAQRDFIADAAHELRTPLTALQLQTQLVERATSDSERTAALNDLKQGLGRTIHMVQQLLTLARQEPGAAEQAFARISLGDLLRQVVADHATLAAAKDVDLGAAATDPAACALGDADALRTLLANLVGNAVRFTPPGGRIDVACGTTNTGAYLEVADNGPGIPPAERERVFDRFYRRGSDDAPGSGLGLAIVRTIADRHGATVHLADAPGGGLLVRIDFPALPTVA